MSQLFKHQFKAMGSPCELHLYSFNQQHFYECCHAVQHEISRLEKKYSRYLSGSLLSAINVNAALNKPITIDDETQALLHYADTAYQLSDGLFDITSGALRQVWNFNDTELPSQQQIDALLPLIGWSKVNWQHQQFSLPIKGMEIDFGGIVKEYAADAAKAIVIKHNITHGLIDLGGDIAIVGPHPDGSPWHIGIRQPDAKNQAIASLPAMSGAVASSGDYERCLMIDGQRYSHILNPKTGWPSKSFAGVSVWAPQCVVAGTVATIAMLKGITLGLKWLDDSGLPFVAVDQQGQRFVNQPTNNS